MKVRFVLKQDLNYQEKYMVETHIKNRRHGILWYLPETEFDYFTDLQEAFQFMVKRKQEIQKDKEN